MTITTISRLTPATVERLARLPTAAIANALDDVGKTVNCPVALRPVAPGMVCEGPAVTVEVLAAEAGTYTSAEGYACDDAAAEKEIRDGLRFSEVMAKFKRIRDWSSGLQAA